MDKNMKYNILITGAQGGLATEIVKKLKKTKHKIFCHSTSNKFDLQIDFNKTEDFEKADSFIKENHINCLINNAGIYSNDEFFKKTNEEIISIFNVNLIAPIILTKNLYRTLIDQEKEGLIININSIAGKYPNYHEAIYCASKYGLTGFSSCLSINQKKSKIKIIDCHIGAMKTKMTEKKENYKNMVDPKYVAKEIVQLLNNKNNYIISSFELRNTK
jgi:short-subunit dehydrogenase